MVSLAIGLFVLCICGPLLEPIETAPIEEEDGINERSFKRELDLFTNEVEDDWEHDDDEFLSARDVLQRAYEHEKRTWKNNLNDNTNEDDKRWLNVDIPQKANVNELSPTNDVELPKNGELFEDDIVMDDYVRDLYNGEAEKRDAVSYDEYRWPNGIIYYVFDPNIDLQSKRVILLALKEYDKYTCIKFEELPHGEAHSNMDYVRFISNGSACYSNVGKRSGRQDVSIGYGCLRVGTPIHEIMHVLGFFHEMARPDRDTVAEVHFEHIQPKMKHNFLKTPLQLDTKLLEYNFCSVMHYSNMAFSKDGEATITSKIDPEKKFGQRCGFSVGDIIEINKLYNCPSSYYDKFKNNNIEETICVGSSGETIDCKPYSQWT